MSAAIVIPTALRAYCQNLRTVDTNANSVGDALQQLVTSYPELRCHLLDEQHAPLGYINVFVNDKNVRDLQGPQTSLADGDEIVIVPALAGG